MTDKTQSTDAVAQPATDRETHFYLAGWNGARGNEDSHEHFRQALQAAPPAPAVVAVPAESQRLAQFLLNMQTRLGSCREACGDEYSMKAWDDYSRAAALLAAKGVLDERELFEAWVRTHEDAHGAFDDGSARAGWEARAALVAAPALASDNESVLIDGIAYEVPAAVAGELLSLHLDLLTAAPAQDVASSITIDFKQANELVAMFGGEPAEVTLIEGPGHCGEGLYAYYSDLPEEGAEFLGKPDNEALPAAPAQEHATQLAGQGQLTWDALRALAIKHGAWVSGYGPFATELLATYGRAPDDQPHWVAKWLVAARAARAAPAQAQEDARDGLSQAARDVLSERARQVDAEGFNHARDDKYVGLQLAGAAASYLILAAGGREDDARAVWPWRQEWLKPGDPRRYLEKAGALALAEMERLDRAAARAAQGGA